jgi:starvation-inducible outer membrane lipoprotein
VQLTEFGVVGLSGRQWHQWVLLGLLLLTTYFMLLYCTAVPQAAQGAVFRG